MPTTTTKFSSIKARRIRVTTLDICGVPLEGTCATIVTSGFVSVNAAAEQEEGEEFTVKNAWGEFCVNEKDASRVKRWNLTIEFCEVDPQLLAMLSGGRVLTTGTDPNLVAVGGTFGEQVGDDFALELWTKVAGGACGTEGGYIYWVFPHVAGGVIGDVTFENGPLSMTISANTLGAGAEWALGPYTPTILPQPLNSDEHIGYVVTSEEPPDDTDGCQALTVAFAATAGTEGGSSTAKGKTEKAA